MTAYQVAKDSGGRISTSALYRLVRAEGRVRYFDAELLDALCDVLKLNDVGTLIERNAKKKQRAVQARR